MVDELCSGPCIVVEICGEGDVHKAFRDLVGPSDPVRFCRNKVIYRISSMWLPILISPLSTLRAKSSRISSRHGTEKRERLCRTCVYIHLSMREGC
jgi:hypothetical protein